MMRTPLVLLAATLAACSAIGCASGEPETDANFNTSFDAYDDFEAAVRSAFRQENVRVDEDMAKLALGVGVSKAAGLNTFVGTAPNGSRVNVYFSRVGRDAALVSVNANDPDDVALEQRIADLLQANLGTVTVE